MVRGNHTLQETARSDCFLGRYAGEELLFITMPLPGATRHAANPHARPCPFSEYREHCVTVSLGLTFYQAGETLATLKRTTQALYGPSSKGGGVLFSREVLELFSAQFLRPHRPFRFSFRSLTAARKNLAVAYSGARLRAR